MWWVAPSAACVLKLPVTRSCVKWEHCWPHASWDMEHHWELRLLFMQPVSTCTTFDQMMYSLRLDFRNTFTAYVEVRR